MDSLISRHYWLWIKVLGAVAVCQLFYPYRRWVPFVYGIAADRHLDAVADWLASY